MSVWYVWSGSLLGAEVRARSPKEAVIEAVKQHLPCVLMDDIRVSLFRTGVHETDTYFHQPYEETFPELFSGGLDVNIGRVEKL